MIVEPFRGLSPWALARLPSVAIKMFYALAFPTHAPEAYFIPALLAIIDQYMIYASVDWGGRSEGGGWLFMGAHGNKAKSAEEFVGKLEELRKNYKERSYYDFNGRRISRKEDRMENYAVLLDEDRAQHIKKRHPDFNEWERIPEIIETGERIELGMDGQTSLPASVFVKTEGNKMMAVIATVAQTRYFGGNYKVLTAFKGSKKGLEDWLTENKKAATSHSTGGSPDVPSS